MKIGKTVCGECGILEHYGHYTKGLCKNCYHKDINRRERERYANDPIFREKQKQRKREYSKNRGLRGYFKTEEYRKKNRERKRRERNTHEDNYKM